MHQGSAVNIPRQSIRGVFLGPMEVAGYFARLSVGLRSIGITTLYADLESHPFSYPEAVPAGGLVRVARRAGAGLANAKTTPTRAVWKVASIATRAALLLRAIVACDVFVFGSGQTLFGLRELPLLKLLGKRVVIVFFGTDVRPSYLDGIESSAPDVTPTELVARTRQKRDRIRRLERHATAIVSHAPMSQLLSRSFAAWLEIGIPTIAQPLADERVDGVLRVVHAPSHAGAKGTSLIRDAIDRLRSDGVAIEYRELQRASNEAVRAAIAQADVVVDQLYADTPMAVLASEAASAGRPAVVGSLDWPSALADVEGSAIPPSIRCAPEEIGDVLRALAGSPESCRDAGRTARDFVRAHWSPEDVARRYAALADGSAPASWFHSPATIRYAAGSGMSLDRLRQVLASVAGVGDESFLVDDKPELEQRLRTGGI